MCQTFYNFMKYVIFASYTPSDEQFGTRVPDTRKFPVNAETVHSCEEK